MRTRGRPRGAARSWSSSTALEQALARHFGRYLPVPTY